MKTTTTIKQVFPLVPGHAAIAGLGATIKARLVRILAEKPMNEKELAQATELSGKRDYYWQQITIGSSRL